MHVEHQQSVTYDEDLKSMYRNRPNPASPTTSFSKQRGPSRYLVSITS
jgi:hypothetical protein